jgi:ABC-type ATPase involved in cell division
VLRLVAVTLRLGEELVLDALTVEARAGEILLIEGNRGAGKTKLLEVAAARRQPDAGEVWIADHDVTALQRASLPFVRRNIGFVEAAPRFLSRATVMENVMLPLAARGEPAAWAREAAVRALGKVGIVGLGAHDPARLSNGSRRLAAIARALAGVPPLVVLDDPSASLSAMDAGAVLSAMCGAVEGGAAVVCASADGAFLAAAAAAGARRLRLDAGRLAPGAGTMVALPGRRTHESLAERPEALLDPPAHLELGS